MTLTRRSLFGGFAGLLAAPAIVKASSLMAVKPVKLYKVTEVSAAWDEFGNLHRVERTVWLDKDPFKVARDFILAMPQAEPRYTLVNPELLQAFREVKPR